MRRFFQFVCIIVCLQIMPIEKSTAEPSGALSPEFIEELRDAYEMNAEDRGRFNAITGTDIKTLALNRDVVNGEDGHFSHKIKTKGITNQKASGRCWMFAGCNVMRPIVIKDLGLDGFEFSAAYLLFWDKMEKSNLYLEQIIELRDVDRLDREWQIVNDEIVGDGGWWNYVTALIEKYGVVPVSVMPETHSSENTGAMNAVLKRLLLSRAARLIKASDEGAEVKALRAIKKEFMAEVYRFLALNLGEPPAEFEWRFESKPDKDKNSKTDAEEEESTSVVQKNLSKLESYTPRTFYDRYVAVDLSQFVSLYHDPALEEGRHFRFGRARNIAGQPEMDFVNVDMKTMKEIGVKSVIENQPMWFAVNMGLDQSRKHGLMEHKLYDYESLFGIDMPVSKADRSRFTAGASTHAMVLMGVDLQDGQPRKWLVENSWGSEKGNKGTWTLYDGWFDEHVYLVTVHKRLLPESILAVFEEEAEKLPAWYPGALGVPGR